MRYRIVIEIDVDAEVRRTTVNALASEMWDLAISNYNNPVFLSTEQVMATEEVQVLRQNRKWENDHSKTRK